MNASLPILNSNPTGHIPVLAEDVVQALQFDRPTIVVDGTLGLGGHSALLLERYPDMRILGFDWDQAAMVLARKRLDSFGDRFEAIERSYVDIPEVIAERGIPGVDGVLLDLGLSSMQLGDTSRGFSFLREGPLDMRMSPLLPKTAWDLLTQLDDEDLANIFWTFGEERSSRRIARALKDRIREQRLTNDAWQVAEVIRKTAPGHGQSIDPATRCFQALRIAVNGELNNIDRALGFLEAVLKPGGRAVLISFHSLEDKRVKSAFQMAAKDCLCPPRLPQCVCGHKAWAFLPKRKAIQASAEEIQRNPRSRSARLRILEKQ